MLLMCHSFRFVSNTAPNTRLLQYDCLNSKYIRILTCILQKKKKKTEKISSKNAEFKELIWAKNKYTKSNIWSPTIFTHLYLRILSKLQAISTCRSYQMKYFDSYDSPQNITNTKPYYIILNIRIHLKYYHIIKYSTIYYIFHTFF